MTQQKDPIRTPSPRLTPPLKWHGGKHYLATKIVELMPRHLHYVEPYCGGGAVLLARDPNDPAKSWSDQNHEQGVSEVINDLDGELTNFWRVLQSPSKFQDFSRIVSVMPFSQIEWADAASPGGDAVDRAVRFFVRCRQSLAGRGNEFAAISRNRTRRGANEQVSAWLSCVEGLPAVHRRLQRVVILNKDAIEVIGQEDGLKTLFYLDPPYLHSTRASTDDYHFEMTEAQHAQLLETLSQIRGKFLLSGYENELYQGFAQRFGWRRVEFDLPNNASGAKSKRRMTECVWMNFG